MADQERTNWTTEQVRAGDLRERDIVRIGGSWTEVMDVWGPDNDPFGEFGNASPLAHDIARALNNRSADWVVVRLVDTGKSTSQEVETILRAMVRWDLVEVQVQKV